MRILITGGVGFIGGRLGQHLQEVGHQVILGSRKVSSSPDWLPQAEVIQIDWHDSRSLEQICEGVDVVIQAAGMNAQNCATDPVAALEFNGLTTARLLAASIHTGVKRFFYLSTAHVYANPLIGNITEETCPRNMHPYATSHLAGEYAVLGARQRGQIEGVVFRLSNAFGMPSHKDANCWMLLVNDLCRQLALTKNLVLHTSGVQSRDFITMNNVVRAIDYFLNLPNTTIGNGLFNLGGGRTLTVFEMAKLIAKRGQTVFAIDARITRPEPEKKDKLVSLVFDITKLEQTGFQLISDMNLEIDNTLRFSAQSAGVIL